MKKRLMKVIIMLIVLTIILYGVYKLMNSRTYQLFGGLTSHVETNEKVVALTFDDGPSKEVDSILALLDRYNAKATFFLVGSELEKYPMEGQKIAKAGHQIGNHTYSHKRMIFKKPFFIEEEVIKTNELIRKTGFEGDIDFRPPNSKKLLILPYYLMKYHMDTITWNLEPDTYYSSSKDKVEYVTNNVKPGSIILLHPMYDGNDEELTVINGILKNLTAEGYQFVSVNELQEIGK